jgi:hypothetical protein
MILLGGVPRTGQRVLSFIGHLEFSQFWQTKVHYRKSKCIARSIDGSEVSRATAERVLVCGSTAIASMGIWICLDCRAKNTRHGHTR